MTTPVALLQWQKRWWTFGPVDPITGLRTMISPGLLPPNVLTEIEARAYVVRNCDMEVGIVLSFHAVKPPLGTYLAVMLEMEKKRPPNEKIEVIVKNEAAGLGAGVVKATDPFEKLRPQPKETVIG